MARTPDLDKRDALLTEAMTWLRTHGVQKISMSRLAEGIGIGRTSLYWYFKDLHALFFAILMKLLHEQETFMEEQLTGITHPIDRLYEHALAVDRFYADRADVLILLTQFWGALGSGSPDEIIQTSRSFFAPRRASFQKGLEQGLTQGTVAPCNPEAVVLMVSALIDGLLVLRITHAGDSASVHHLLWERVLAPLKRSPS